MTRKEAEYLYGWLENSYPRNYRDADARRIATTVDNLGKVFAQFPYQDVLAVFEQIYASQKNEPHPSEVKARLMSEREERHGRAAEFDPYEVLRRKPEWDEFCHAYGEKACKRAAKLCVQTASIAELKWRLMMDE